MHFSCHGFLLPLQCVWKLFWRRGADSNRRIKVLQTSPLTTWVPRLDSVACGRRHGRCSALTHLKTMERETGFEPATSTLARSHSTAELLPLLNCIIQRPSIRGNPLQIPVWPASEFLAGARAPRLQLDNFFDSAGSFRCIVFNQDGDAHSGSCAAKLRF